MPWTPGDDWPEVSDDDLAQLRILYCDLMEEIPEDVGEDYLHWRFTLFARAQGLRIVNHNWPCEVAGSESGATADLIIELPITGTQIVVVAKVAKGPNKHADLGNARVQARTCLEAVRKVSTAPLCLGAIYTNVDRFVVLWAVWSKDAVRAHRLSRRHGSGSVVEGETELEGDVTMEEAGQPASEETGIL